MNFKNKLAIAFTMVLMVVSFGIQAQFSLSGEIRPRSEMSHGYSTLAGPDQDASFFTSQRTRLNFNYTKGIVTSKIVLQDVRLWGSQKQLVGNEANAASIHEAWAEAKLFKGLSIKLGRQELVYDDHRIFGSVGWAQQARSHDVALLKYKGIVNLHAGVAYNQNSDRSNNIYAGPDAYKNMHFIWLNRKMDKYTFSLLFLNNGTPYTIAENADGDVTSEGIRYSQTAGAFITYKLGKFKFAGNYYMQMGEDKAGKELNAYEFAISANYKINDKLSAGARYEMLSGTSFEDAAGETNNSFTPFYGTNHKFNGWMDYFYVGNHANNVGLNDLVFDVKYKMGKASVAAFYHNFAPNADLTMNGSSSFGSEIDLVFGYVLSKEVKFNVGYSHLMATETMVDLKGGDMDETQNWAWVMFTFSPTFFKSEK